MFEQFDFSEDPQRVAILEDACRELDLIDRLQRKLDSLGDDLRVSGSMNQPVAAPELAEVRHHRKVFADLIRALCLPETPAAAAAQFDHATAKRIRPGPGDKRLQVVS